MLKANHGSEKLVFSALTASPLIGPFARVSSGAYAFLMSIHDIELHQAHSSSGNHLSKLKRKIHTDTERIQASALRHIQVFRDYF